MADIVMARTGVEVGGSGTRPYTVYSYDLHGCGPYRRGDGGIWHPALAAAQLRVDSIPAAPSFNR